MAIAPKPCEICGQPVPIPAYMSPAGYAKRRFCSRTCFGVHHRNRVTVTCAQCGKVFDRQVNAVKSDEAFCSKACAYAFRRTVPDATCRQCGKVYRPYGHGMGDKFCSAACYIAYKSAMTPEEREAMMSAARAAVLGKKQTDEHRAKIAQTKQAIGKLSEDETEILAAMRDAGLDPIPLYAIHRYNIDFAFPDARIAVEYNGGNWHNTPKKQAADEVKFAYLRDHGWTILVFPRLDKPQPNNAGNRRIAIDEIVRQVRQYT